MASTSSMDVQHGVRKLLAAADPDLACAMLRGAVQALMSAEADEQCGADYGERSAERVNSRNG
jgi:putative transposase